MSGYVELKIRTSKNMGNKFIEGLMAEMAAVLKMAGYAGAVKCTNTKQEVSFVTEEVTPKMKPVADGEVSNQ